MTSDTTMNNEGTQVIGSIEQPATTPAVTPDPGSDWEMVTDEAETEAPTA